MVLPALRGLVVSVGMNHVAAELDRCGQIAEARLATAVTIEHMLSEFTVEAGKSGGGTRIDVLAAPETFQRVAAQVLALYEDQMAMEAPGDDELREALSEDVEATPELQVLAILAPALFILGYSPVALPPAATALIDRARAERLIGAQPPGLGRQIPGHFPGRE